MIGRHKYGVRFQMLPDDLKAQLARLSPTVRDTYQLCAMGKQLPVSVLLT